MRLISAFLGILISAGVFAQGDLKSAMKLTFNEQYEDAEAAYKSLLNTNPENSEVYFYYGQNVIKGYLADTFSYAVKDVSDKAEDLFRKGIKADSTFALNYVGLGMVKLLLYSDTLKADVFFSKAESTIPKRKKAQTTHDAKVLTELGAAQMLGRVNRYNKAIAYLERAKLIDGLNPLIYIALGDIYMRMNEGPNTMANYNKALALDPTSPLPKIRIGDIYMRVPNPNAARPYLEEARNIDSTYAPVFRALGELYTSVGRYDIAKINYRKFLALSGNNIPAKVHYGISLFKSKNYAEALSVIEEVLAVDKSRNYLNRLAGYCAYEKKPPELEKGKKHMEAFFAGARPDQIITKDYSYYGRILLRLAKTDSLQLLLAFDNLTKAYKADTTDLSLVNEMALTYYNLHWYRNSIVWFNHKIALTNKTITEDRMFIGKAYYQLKEYGKADTVFMKVTETAPNYIQAYLYDARSMGTIEQNMIEQKTGEPGIAKPKFELLIIKIAGDSIRYGAELVEAYSYMGSYNYFKKPSDYPAALSWFKKIYYVDVKKKEWQIKSLKSQALIKYVDKKYTEARDLYKQVQTMDPKDAVAEDGIKRLDKAIKAIADAQQ
jgi:tetratricopeptide (TPR) repeat protein